VGLVEEDKRTDGRPTHVEAEGLKSRAVAIATEGKAAKRGVCFFHRTMGRKTCRGRVRGGEGADCELRAEKVLTEEGGSRGKFVGSTGALWERLRQRTCTCKQPKPDEGENGAD
jgi:hypothetical protein